MNRALLVLTIASVTLLSAATASGQDTRLALFGTLGFGGEADAEWDLDNSLVGGESKADLDPTLGAGFSYDKALADVLSLGLLFRFNSWSADSYPWEFGEDNQGLAFDIDFLPRLRFPARKLELYFTVPAGLSVGTKDETNDVEYDLGWGWNVGVFGGIQFPLNRDVAAFVELGGMTRKLTHNIDAENAEGDLEYQSAQLMLNLGAAFF